MRKKIDYLILINTFWVFLIFAYALTFNKILLLVGLVGSGLTIVYEVKLLVELSTILNSGVRERMKDKISYNICLSIIISLVPLAFLYRML